MAKLHLVYPGLATAVSTAAVAAIVDRQASSIVLLVTVICVDEISHIGDILAKALNHTCIILLIVIVDAT